MTSRGTAATASGASGSSLSSSFTSGSSVVDGMDATQAPRHDRQEETPPEMRPRAVVSAAPPGGAGGPGRAAPRDRTVTFDLGRRPQRREPGAAADIRSPSSSSSSAADPAGGLRPEPAARPSSRQPGASVDGAADATRVVVVTRGPRTDGPVRRPPSLSAERRKCVVNLAESTAAQRDVSAMSARTLAAYRLLRLTLRQRLLRRYYDLWLARLRPATRGVTVGVGTGSGPGGPGAPRQSTQETQTPRGGGREGPDTSGLHRRGPGGGGGGGGDAEGAGDNGGGEEDYFSRRPRTAHEMGLPLPSRPVEGVAASSVPARPLSKDPRRDVLPRRKSAQGAARARLAPDVSLPGVVPNPVRVYLN